MTTAAVMGFTTFTFPNVPTKRSQPDLSFIANFPTVRSISFATSYDFNDFPMDEISQSLASGEIIVPNNLTLDEMDAWLMGLDL